MGFFIISSKCLSASVNALLAAVFVAINFSLFISCCLSSSVCSSVIISSSSVKVSIDVIILKLFYNNIIVRTIIVIILKCLPYSWFVPNNNLSFRFKILPALSWQALRNFLSPICTRLRSRLRSSTIWQKSEDCTKGFHVLSRVLVRSDRESIDVNRVAWHRASAILGAVIYKNFY